MPLDFYQVSGLASAMSRSPFMKDYSDSEKVACPQSLQHLHCPHCETTSIVYTISMSLPFIILEHFVVNVLLQWLMGE